MKERTGPNLLAERLQDIREELARAAAASLALRVGGIYEVDETGEEKLTLEVFGRPTVLSFPNLVAHDEHGEELPFPWQVLLAYYCHTSDGAPVVDRWISFTDLPDGRFYNQAFLGYTGKALSAHFGDSLEEFNRCAEMLGGERVDLGNAAFSFKIFPLVPVAVVCWLGDEDIPTSYQVLFDASACRHLTTDACAVLGAMLMSQLVKCKELKSENSH